LKIAIRISSEESAVCDKNRSACVRFMSRGQLILTRQKRSMNLKMSCKRQRHTIITASESWRRSIDIWVHLLHLKRLLLLNLRTHKPKATNRRLNLIKVFNSK